MSRDVFAPTYFDDYYEFSVVFSLERALAAKVPYRSLVFLDDSPAASAWTVPHVASVYNVVLVPVY